jgi:hypothetical protein
LGIDGELDSAPAHDVSVAPGAWPRVPLRERLHHVLRTRVSEHPALYLPFARRKYPGPSPEVIGPETELVIDGYTRSATTFAVYAFQLVQERPVRMAHHLHAPAQLIAAAKMGVPALALIRDPEGAILSQVIREPDVTVRGALVAYARFYSCLLPYRSNLVTGEFEEVTNDFGSVVRRINDRFGISFAEFEHTEANVRECIELMGERPTLWPTLLGWESGTVSLSQLRRERELGSRWTAQHDAADAWVPSADRDRTKDVLRERWRRDDLAELRTRAKRVYEEFLSG